MQHNAISPSIGPKYGNCTDWVTFTLNKGILVGLIHHYKKLAEKKNPSDMQYYSLKTQKHQIRQRLNATLHRDAFLRFSNLRQIEGKL